MYVCSVNRCSLCHMQFCVYIECVGASKTVRGQMYASGVNHHPVAQTSILPWYLPTLTTGYMQGGVQ